MKTAGGAKGILDNEQALLDWAVSGPYIADMIDQSDIETDCQSHHEDTAVFEKKTSENIALFSLVQTKNLVTHSMTQLEVC